MKKVEERRGTNVGLRLSRLQGQNTTFYRVIKTTRCLSKTTPKPQSGVRFGVRCESMDPSAASGSKWKKI